MKGRRKHYEITLVWDDEMTFTMGHTDNCRLAFRLAFEALRGVPSCQAIIRADGAHLAFFLTNWRGELRKIEVWSPTGTIQRLNPTWTGWSRTGAKP